MVCKSHKQHCSYWVTEQPYSQALEDYSARTQTVAVVIPTLNEEQSIRDILNASRDFADSPPKLVPLN